jgi:hypothetical protein
MCSWYVCNLRTIYCRVWVDLTRSLAMYNISVVDYTMANPGNALGIFEDGDIYDQADLNLLYKTLAYVTRGPGTVHFQLADLPKDRKFLKAPSQLGSPLTVPPSVPLRQMVAANRCLTCPCRFPLSTHRKCTFSRYVRHSYSHIDLN